MLSLCQCSYMAENSPYPRCADRVSESLAPGALEAPVTDVLFPGNTFSPRDRVSFLFDVLERLETGLVMDGKDQPIPLWKVKDLY